MPDMFLVRACRWWARGGAGAMPNAARDPEAWFDVLYRRHRDLVLGYCLRRAPRADALDAAAETFLVAWRRREDVPGHPRVWLLAVARRVLANQRRGRGRRDRLHDRLVVVDPPRVDGRGPERVVLVSEQRQEVRDAMARLSDDDREVLMLATWDELPHTEIADLLGISTAAVTKRLERARSRLASQLHVGTTMTGGTRDGA